MADAAMKVTFFFAEPVFLVQITRSAIVHAVAVSPKYDPVSVLVLQFCASIVRSRHVRTIILRVRGRSIRYQQSIKTFSLDPQKGKTDFYVNRSGILFFFTQTPLHVTFTIAVVA